MSQLLKALGIRERRSFASISSTPISIRSNVLSSSSAANNGGIITIPDRTLNNYLTTMNECKAYECFILIQNILKLLVDYVKNQLDLENKEYIEIPDDTVLSKKVNKLIKESGFNDKFIKDISDIIYFGGKGYKIDVFSKPGENYNRINLVDLKEPYIITRVYDREKAPKHYDRFINNRVIPKYNVYQDREVVEVNNEDILFIGNQDFKLTDNSSNNDRLSNKGSNNNILLTDDYSIYASKPLLYSVMSDIKNYIVYKTLSSVLSVKDVLIPTFMRLGVDLTKATTTDKINETVNELESKINESIDTTLVMGQQLNINQLINSVFSSVRVLPDPGNLLSSVDAINLDPLKDKLEQINSKTEETEKGILDALGIPSDLFEGGSNQYEVFTRNQRYQATIGSLLANFKKLYKECVIKLYRIKYPNAKKEDIEKLDNMIMRLFRVSSIELNKDKELTEQNKELADSINQLVQTFEDMIKNNSLIDDEKCLAILKSTMGNLGTTYKDIIVTELPKDTEESGSGGW